MEVYRAEVQSNRGYGQARMIEFHSPGIARAARPGQFVHVLCGDDSGRILRRPYSIFSARDGSVGILLKRVGSGSRWLAERAPGEPLDVLGPLGRGFGPGGEGRSALVAGGTGIAPLYYQAVTLTERGRSPRIFWGMEGGADFGALPEELAAQVELRLCSMDGTCGEKGTALDLFCSSGPDEYDAVFACGPVQMLKGLEAACRAAGRPLEVCLEERMACGVGACQGCAVPTRSVPGGYVTACREGPSFSALEIDWERMA